MYYSEFCELVRGLEYDSTTRRSEERMYGDAHLHEELRRARLARRVARIGNEVQRRLGPDLLQRVRCRRRTEHVVPTLHDDAGDVAAGGVAMSAKPRGARTLRDALRFEESAYILSISCLSRSWPSLMNPCRDKQVVSREQCGTGE